jgi:hypothetical protein
MKKFWILKVVVIAAIAILGFGAAVMLLWNALIPVLFGGPVITFLQAIGLLVLSKIFLKGFGCKGHRWGHHQWRERMQERMSAMTPEEREKFREQWRKRCGRFGKWHDIDGTGPATTE